MADIEFVDGYQVLLDGRDMDVDEIGRGIAFSLLIGIGSMRSPSDLDGFASLVCIDLNMVWIWVFVMAFCFIDDAWP